MNKRVLVLHLVVFTLIYTPLVAGFAHGYLTAHVNDCGALPDKSLIGISPQQYCLETLGTEQEQRIEAGLSTGLKIMFLVIPIGASLAISHLLVALWVAHRSSENGVVA